MVKSSSTEQQTFSQRKALDDVILDGMTINSGEVQACT